MQGHQRARAAAPRRYQTASINEEQSSLFAEQLVALAQPLQAQHTPLPQRSKKRSPGAPILAAARFPKIFPG
ncbi:MAG: hypothetical protein IPK21_22985 [Haliscomenobacter sp.]|nr:hypothetical protein [Haliscomenobacter sp.]